MAQKSRRHVPKGIGSAAQPEVAGEVPPPSSERTESLPHVSDEAPLPSFQRPEPLPHVPEFLAQSFEIAKSDVRNDTRANAHVVDESVADGAEDDAIPLHQDVRVLHRSLRNQRTRTSWASAFFAAIAIVALGGLYFAFVERGPTGDANDKRTADVSTQAAPGTNAANATNATNATAVPERSPPTTVPASAGATEVAAAPPANEAEPADSSAPESVPQQAASTEPAAGETVATSRPTERLRASESVGSRPKQSARRVRPGVRTEMASPRTETASRRTQTASQRSERVLRSDTGAASTSRQSDADAIATERLIAQDLARFSGSSGTSVSRASNADTRDVQRDRDAIETQRLVERDRRAFKERSARSAPDRAFPEIN